jgi:Zn-dependent metalloprotease
MRRTNRRPRRFLNRIRKETEMTPTQKILCASLLLALGGTASAAGASAGHPAVERALALLHTHGAQVRASADDRFQAREVIVDADGTEHVRFERSYAGLPVLGGDFVLHSRNGLLQGASLTQRAPLQLSPRPGISAADAIVAAGVAFGRDFEGKPESSLVVYARSAQPRLAYQVRLQAGEEDLSFIVAADDGRVLDRWSNRETAAATGTGKTLYSGNVAIGTNSIAGGFEMRDPSRGGGYTINAGSGRTSGQIFKDADNSWGNNTATDLASAASDAQFGVATTWDYYKLVHGRNGIANDGKGASNRVHYGRKYGNAFWSDSCFCMTYGDGDGVTIGPLVALDITGHEMSHGVTSRSANLAYSGEPGGLNEATSDIFGSMVEFRANNSVDTPDYLIGEELFIANVPGSANQAAIRYMFDPSKDGLSPNCWSAAVGGLDVHYSSGPANRFFYLLAEGSGARTYSGVNHKAPTCNGSTLAGIGRAKAEKVWYRALTVYMTSNTDYAGARVATLSAASDLYGPSSAERAAVAASWSAVNVND